MIDPQVAFDKLNGFQTPDELAEYFKSEDIQGTKATHENCPIAKWMTKTTGMTSSAAHFILILDARSDFFVSTPKVMLDFMALFDAGHYPELVENRESNISSFWSAASYRV